MIKLSRHHSLFGDGRLEQSLEEHRVIIAALLAHDAEAAGQRMHDHILSGRAALQRMAAKPCN
jgi:DNA-binding GntR family transcriptional regulator